MSCRILIQIKKAGEETSIQDYYKFAANQTSEIDYNNLLAFWCDSVITGTKEIVVVKNGKRLKAFNLNGQPSQPYNKGVTYNEVEMTDDFNEMMNKELKIQNNSKLTSWIYIECTHI